MIIKEKGIITHLWPEITGTSKAGNAYTIREFVIEVNDEGYKNSVHFKAMGSTVRDLEEAREGDTIEVSYKPTSREHNGRWYDEMRLFSVRLTRQPEPNTQNAEDPSNDLPF